eukprot:802095-Pelagomonas_calceolata.AAC.2
MRLELASLDSLHWAYFIGLTALGLLHWAHCIGLASLDSLHWACFIILTALGLLHWSPCIGLASLGSAALMNSWSNWSNLPHWTVRQLFFQSFFALLSLTFEHSVQHWAQLLGRKWCEEA